MNSMLETPSSDSAAVVRGITIAMPTFNRGSMIGSSIDSVLAVQIPAGVEVELVVIDNGCTDNTADVVDSRIPSARFTLRRVIEEQQGLCFGRNRALREARYPHVVYLDDDIELNPAWLVGYVEAVEQLQADCVIGPVHPKFNAPLPDFMTEPVTRSISSPYSQKGKSRFLVPSEKAHEIPGCNFGVRLQAAKDVEGFDNTLDRVGAGLLAGGDFDFGMRLVQANKRIVYEPRCSIQHVILTEKLTKDYLRKRWYGVGATLRTRTPRTPAGQRLRYWLSVVRLYLASGWAGLTGKRGLAFQRELEALKTIGFLRTPPRSG